MNNKGADQPAHPRSLKSAFVIRCLDSIIPLVSISKISSLNLATVPAQAGLNLTWSANPKDRFSRDEAHMMTVICLASLVFLFPLRDVIFDNGQQPYLSVQRKPKSGHL